LQKALLNISDEQVAKLLHRMFYVMLVMLFKYLLDSYYDFFSDFFGYYGMLKEPRSPLVFILAYAIIFIMACFIPIHVKKPSNLFTQLLFLMQYVPVSSFFVYYDKSSVGGFVGITFVYAGMILISRLKSEPVWRKAMVFKPKAFILIMGGVSLLFTLLAMQKYGFSLKSVDFSSLYTLRAEFKEETNRLYGYIFSWTSHVLITVMMVLALRKKNYILLFITLVLGYYFFTLGGHKAVLFTLPYLFILFFIIKYFRENFGIMIVGGFVLMTGALYLVDLHHGTFNMASSIAVRRNFLMPAQLYFNYVDYFSTHQVDYFAQNFPFNIFHETNYGMPLPRIIAEAFLPRGHETYANTGVVADTFANLGYWGFPVVLLFFFVFFRICDQLAQYRDSSFVTTVLSVFVLNFINGGLIVNIITHGLLITLLIIALYPRKSYISKETPVFQ
jgi:hypothetical protein